MGAHFCAVIIKAGTEAQAVAAARSRQMAEQHESGHGPYSGHLGTAGVGVVTCREKFDSARAAEEWVADNHHKSGLPYLIRVGETDEWLLAGWCRS